MGKVMGIKRENNVEEIKIKLYFTVSEVFLNIYNCISGFFITYTII